MALRSEVIGSLLRPSYLAEARMREDRVARETERVLREHGEAWDDVQVQMDHVRSSLTALTGRAAE